MKQITGSRGRAHRDMNISKQKDPFKELRLPHEFIHVGLNILSSVSPRSVRRLISVCLFQAGVAVFTPFCAFTHIEVSPPSSASERVPEKPERSSMIMGGYVRLSGSDCGVK